VNVCLEEVVNCKYADQGCEVKVSSLFPFLFPFLL
jgi:hypothetical protein